MTRWPITLAAALLCLALPIASHALTVVDFEDVSPNDLADGYGGLSGWAGMGGPGISDADQGAQGLKAFYGQGGLLRFDGAPVRVSGLLYKSYAVVTDPADPPPTAYELWYQGHVVARVTDPRSGLAMAWLTSGYGGPVDALYVFGGLEGFSIDHLQYEAVSSVPAPPPWLLLCGGLGLLGWHRRAASGPRLRQGAGRTASGPGAA